MTSMNAPVTTASGSVGKSGRPRKLRTSCDGCHSAKVKCTKSKPACTRCLSLGFCCVYSPSLRAGKIRQKSRDDDAETPVRNELDLTGISWDHAFPRPESSLRDGELADFQFDAGHDGFSGFEDFPDRCSTIWSDSVGGPGPLVSIPNDHSGSTLDSDPTSLDSTQPTTSPFITSPSSSHNLTSYLQDDIDLSGLMPQSLSDFDLTRSDSNKNDRRPSDQQSSVQSGKASSVCPQLSYTDIGQKEPTHESMAWSSSRCFSSLVHALHTLQCQTDTGSTSLDIVLATSKKAVGWCEAVLGCACAGDSTVIMLLAALVGKILALYHSTYEARKTASVDKKLASEREDVGMDLVTPESSASPTGARSLLDMTISTAKIHTYDVNDAATTLSSHRASPARVTLGAYKLDSEDEGRLELELMLIELRKVDSLLGRFRKRVGMVSVKHESRTYESLAILLAKTLRSTVERLQRNVVRSF